MSETVSRDQRVPVASRASRVRGVYRRGRRAIARRRGRWVALGIVVVVAAVAVSAWRAGVFSPAASSGAGQQGGARAGDGGGDPAGSRGNHAGDRDAGVCRVLHGAGQGGGTLTWLPSAGQVIRQGQVLYKTGNGAPVVLLYGSVPAGGPWTRGCTGAGRVAS